MDEAWKDIKGYEGKYQISNFGRVKSLKHKNKDKILKPLIKEKGYVRVHLTDNGKNDWIYVHRLVAEAFIDKKGGNVVNHLDNNPSNNNANNLEWTTQKENIQYAVRQGRMYQQENYKKAKMAQNGTKRH